MSLITGSVLDTGYQSMYPEALSLLWTLSDPASTDTGLVIATRQREIIPDTNGGFSFTTISTDLMDQDAYYTLAIRSLDPDFNGPDQGFPIADFPQWRIKVPEGEWNLSTLIRTANGGGNPMAWYFQPDEPDPFAMGAIWVNSATGDVNQKVG